MSTIDADGLSFEAKSSQSRSLRHPATVVSDADAAATKDEDGLLVLVLVHPKAVNRKIRHAAAAKVKAKTVMSMSVSRYGAVLCSCRCGVGVAWGRLTTYEDITYVKYSSDYLCLLFALGKAKDFINSKCRR